MKAWVSDLDRTNFLWNSVSAYEGELARGVSRIRMLYKHTRTGDVVRALYPDISFLFDSLKRASGLRSAHLLDRSYDQAYLYEYELTIADI